MLTITRARPEVGALEQRVSRFFNDALRNLDWEYRDSAAASWTPPVDIFEEADAIRIQAELPGIKPDQVQLSVEGNVLSLSGTKQQESETRTERVHRFERTYGAFERTFTLPTTIDPAGIKAAYEHGVLTVVLPKVEKAKPRQIPVQVSKS
jgi:HSP20 family protein